MAGDLKPEQVFTPRSPKVNTEMYVPRDNLEAALLRGLDGAKHLLLHGESGSGKSWLYKQVFHKNQITYEVVNLADASRFGSISGALQNIVNRRGEATKLGYKETKSATVNAGFAKGDLRHEANYELGQADPFEQCLRSIRDRAKTGKAVLVLDNLESVFGDESRIKELADLITLVDDEAYSQYRVKFLIVGVPADLQRYFYNTPNMRTVGNRVTELPEVFRFDEEHTRRFVRRGFLDLLRIVNNDAEALLSRIACHVLWVAGGIPQRLHEYCLLLANIALSEGARIAEHQLERADRDWLQESGYQAYSVVEAAMNEKATRAQRRNQVLYAIGQIEASTFRATDIEPIVRKVFSDSTADVTLNVPQLFADLAARDNPVIRRSPKGDTFVYSDPVYRMALRAMLTVDKHEVVQKKEISALFGGRSS